MRKRLFLAAVAVVVNVAIAMAQQIAVVSDGTTTMYQTLKDAITGAPGGSVIYLPGGGFQIADDVKITKKLTIIGIGHKPNGGSADGNTIISGNLFFDGGSDYSAVMGCYISGDVNIGNDGSSVNNVTVKRCNLKGVRVKDNTCTGTMVCQNYIRDESRFGYASGTIINNIMSKLTALDSGTLSNNILNASIVEALNSTISYNIIIINSMQLYLGGSTLKDNMAWNASGEGIVTLSGVDPNDVFTDYNNGIISPASNFHFKDDYAKYENTIGIYAGENKFNDSGMAPVPYIMAKKIAEQTDASGMLNVKIRVKAGE